jgi:hypothetical protein
MEELVRRLIREKRQQSSARRCPSEIVEHHFGRRHGVDLGETPALPLPGSGPARPRRPMSTTVYLLDTNVNMTRRRQPGHTGTVRR